MIILGRTGLLAGDDRSKMMKFALEMMKFVLEMIYFVFKMKDFVIKR